MIHIIGDIIQSIGVIIAAITVYCFPEYQIVDPLTTILFAVLVLFTTLPIIKQCMNVIMEATPIDINMKHLKKDLIDVSNSLIKLDTWY
jgi:zinc transporter 2